MELKLLNNPLLVIETLPFFCLSAVPSGVQNKVPELMNSLCGGVAESTQFEVVPSGVVWIICLQLLYGMIVATLGSSKSITIWAGDALF
jgi:hypothetical protein